jgi:hypothetical protein
MYREAELCHAEGVTNKRQSRRAPKRFNVRFGEDELIYRGFTRNISQNGAFVTTINIPPVGSLVHLQVSSSGNHSVCLDAVVRHHRLVPPQMRRLEQPGFGVEFVQCGNLLLQIHPYEEKAVCLPETFLSEKQLQESWRPRISREGLLVPASQILPSNCPVTLVLELKYLSKTLRVATRVVRNATGSGGLMVAFLHSFDEFMNELRPFFGL